MDHPLLEKRGRLSAYAAIWSLIATVHIVVLAKNQGLPWSLAALDGVLSNATYALLALTFWYASKYITLDKLAFWKVAENHIFASVFTTALWLGAVYLLLTNLFEAPATYVAFVEASLIWRGVVGILFYFLVIAFYYVYIFSENYRAQLKREAKLETMVKEAQLRSLKFQINPHFIFNSLNSINALTMTCPDKAGEMTIKLGDYLRYTLSHNEKQTSTLREEIDSLKLYLDIEKVRFGDRLEYDERVSESCLDMHVPSMILQPIIENAIKHGVYESLEKVEIRFSCEQNGNYLKATVENTFDPEAVSFKGEGIGLRNVRERLEMLYNHVNLLDIDKEANLFRVNLFIPIEEN